MIAAWQRFWFEPGSPSPICLFRICYGLLTVVHGLFLAPDFLTWYGHNGVASVETIRELADSPRLSLLLWFDPGDSVALGMLVTYIVAGLFLTVGFSSRLMSVVVWVLMVSFSLRNPRMYHHVDPLLRLYGLGLILSPCGAMYSVDAWLKRKSGNTELPICAPWAQRLIQFQVSMVYFRAFWTKIEGQPWWDGTAVYYAVHWVDAVRHPVPPLFDHLWIYQLLTWGTLGIEFCLFSLIWVRRCRYWVLAGGLILHLGIQWCLNLDLLEYAIVAGYIPFIFPADLERWLRHKDQKEGHHLQTEGADVHHHDRA